MAWEHSDGLAGILHSPVPIDSGKWLGAVNVGLVFLFIAQNSRSIHPSVLPALGQGSVFPGKGSL